jgi:hypothetical protein
MSDTPQNAVPAKTRPQGPLPLVIGVTGHRDLREEDIPQLEAQVRAVFAELRGQAPSPRAQEQGWSGLRRRLRHVGAALRGGAGYPHTPLALLSPLAEGADRLVARVALQEGVRLIVPLPMPQSVYEQDFETEASRAEFLALLDRAEYVFQVPPAQGLAEQDLATQEDPESEEEVRKRREARSRRYAQMGAYIALHSQIMIALWDGVLSDALGGTAHVVGFMLEGVPEEYDPGRGVLDPMESGPVYHILTPRKSNPDPAGTPLALDRRYPQTYRRERHGPESGSGEARAASYYERIFGSTEAFNRDFVERAPRLESRIQESKRYVVPDGTELPPAAAAILERYAITDTLAQHYQKTMIGTMLLLHALVFVAALCFDLFAHPLHDARVLIGYLLLMTVAAGLYWWTALREYQDRYQDYRALAEGLRVQLFWYLAGLPDSVADYYLGKQRSELDWLRNAIRVWDLLSGEKGSFAFPDTPEEQEARLRLVRDRWVKDQAAYFEGKTAHRHLRHKPKKRSRKRNEHESLELCESLVRGFMAVGISLAVLMAAFSLAGFFPAEEEAQPSQEAAVSTPGNAPEEAAGLPGHAFPGGAREGAARAEGSPASHGSGLAFTSGPPSARHELLGPDHRKLRDWWIVFMGMAPVLAALFHNYSEKRAFAEHVKQYQRMKGLYQYALERIDGAIHKAMEANDYREVGCLIRELGKEALAENGEWILLHRARPVQVPHAG